MKETLVMKFGGASVATPKNFSSIADLIISRTGSGKRIIVVISAMQQATDRLIDLALQVNPNPPQREYDMLISTGERVSMSLLAMALCGKNADAVSFTGSQSGIITCNNHTQARIIDVRPGRLSEYLDAGKIVIVAGFQGVSLHKEITTLGRGGSDTTAVALGVALGATRVEFFKDVPGIFDSDPKTDPSASQYSRLTYEQASDIVNRGAKILHPRAIALAEKNRLPLYVRSFLCSDKDDAGTIVSDPSLDKRAEPQYEEGVKVHELRSGF